MTTAFRVPDVPGTATLRVPAGDVAIERFIAAWASGDEPLVADFVPVSPGLDDTELAAELVRIDMHERASRGQQVCLDSYLADIPELKETPVEIIALILDEYSIRTESGQSVTLDEYARRFPEHLDTLRRELDLTEEVTGEYGARPADASDAVESPPGKGDADRLAEPTAHRLPLEENPDVGAQADWPTGFPDPGDAVEELVVDSAPATRSEATHIGSLSRGERLIPGTRLGDFQVERLIGQGGLSRVYKARQLSLDRIVALKVTAEPEDERTSRDEGRTMAALVHDHIVPVFSQEQVGGFEVLAMGYVPGPTLSEVLDVLAQVGRRKLTGHTCLELIDNLSDRTRPAAVDDRRCEASGNFLRFACRVIRDLARALAHAHHRGIQHCDVKPANILFAPCGRAMLTDFNVSTRSDEESDSAVGGTLQYMSPEQLAAVTGVGSSDRIDERSDVYSLGLVLFELLTGTRPFSNAVFSGNPLTIAGELLATRLSPNLEIPDADIRLPSALKSVIRQCLTASSEDRYQSAAELAEDLDRWLSSQPLKHAPDTDQVDRARRWVVRHRTWAVLLASVAMVAVISTFRPGPTTIVIDGKVVEVPAADVVKRSLDFDREAQELLEQDEIGKALQRSQAAVQLNPDHGALRHNLGVVQYRRGAFADAVESFSEAIEAGWETGQTYSNRAAARCMLNDTAGARADFEQSVKLASPDNRDTVESNFDAFRKGLHLRSEHSEEES